MADKAYVGIDSGAKGAIAVITETGEVVINDMPTLEELMKDTTGLKACKGNAYRVAIEQVHPLPGQSCIASFTYGENFLLAKLIGMCYNIHPVMVSPQRWKKHYGLKKEPNETKTEYKRKSVEKARELFPQYADVLKYSKDGRAEALSADDAIISGFLYSALAINNLCF